MRPTDAWTSGDSLGWGRGAADGWGDGEGWGEGWGWGMYAGRVGFSDGSDLDCLLSDGGGGGDGWGWGSGTGDGAGDGSGDGRGCGDDTQDSSRSHRSRAIRRLPPSKKVLDERRPLAPWILLTKDPEPSPAPPEEGRSEKASRREPHD